MQAVVTYESGKKLHRLGKALARGSNFKAWADAAMETLNLGEAIERRIRSNISKQGKRLCSTVNPSLLRGMTKEAMFNFSWEAVGKELQTKAWLFLRCILAAADPSNGTTTIYDPKQNLSPSSFSVYFAISSVNCGNRACVCTNH